MLNKRLLVNLHVTLNQQYVCLNLTEAINQFKLHPRTHSWTCLFYCFSFTPENSIAVKSGGCFPASASVYLSDGSTKHVEDLKEGDKVLAADELGNIVYSDFIAFLDRDVNMHRTFVVLETSERNVTLRLTAAHLVFVRDNSAALGMAAKFASRVKPGQEVFVWEGQGRLRSARVERVYTVEDRGSYAPLTSHGTIVVDGVLASCYAAVEEHRWVHWAFAPLRLSHALTATSWWRWSVPDSIATSQQDGIHWYPKMLLHVGTWLLDRDSFHPLGISSLSWDSYNLQECFSPKCQLC